MPVFNGSAKELHAGHISMHAPCTRGARSPVHGWEAKQKARFLCTHLLPAAPGSAMHQFPGLVGCTHRVHGAMG